MRTRQRTKIPRQELPSGETPFLVPGIHIGTISAFLRGRHDADVREYRAMTDAQERTASWPTPLLGQIVGTSTERKRFGHVFAAMMLVPVDELNEKAEKLGADANVIQRGQAAFASLDHYRRVPDGVLLPKVWDDINKQAAELTTPAIVLGKRIVEILTAEDYAARLVAADALLALRADAVATRQQAAA